MMSTQTPFGGESVLASEAARREIRAGRHPGQTAGLAPGFVQGNLVILPQRYADDFLRFCQRNPKPCPVLAVSEVGDPRLPSLGGSIDIRQDVPRYRIYRDGVLTETVTHLQAVWQADWVTFLLGCSFSFEQALMDDGIALRHIANGKNVSMYRTNIQTQSAGCFSGPLVVSMRPMSVANSIRAVQITSRFPGVHGAPIHWGDPQGIGIDDIEKPDYGDVTPILDGEVPVFWACGVTPQAALLAAKPSICVTHEPGCMLITDLLNTRLASF
jgi:uncharacterized protein YcsI (UPF0317 family)